jgi:acetylornithine deacetylase/succinyl-diaminopimelate desuccinylase-like protein
MRYVNTRLLRYVIDKACDIQQIPAPTFSESERADYVFNDLTRLGVPQVSRDAVGNVYAGIHRNDGPCLVVTAHLDTVHRGKDPLGLERSPERISGPGIGDNSLGVATLLGIARYMMEAKRGFGGEVWLVANVCEEGLGNLAGMQAVVEHFGPRAGAYIILEGLGLGQVCHRGLGVLRYRVTAETAGGHAWGNYGAPSAIHELAGVISAITALPVARKPRTSLNIGVIQGGTSVNTIASSAWFEIDLRSEDQATLTRLANRIKRLVKSRARAGVGMKIEPIGSRPAGGIRPSHPLVKLSLEILAELNVSTNLEIGSTDANYALSKGFPAVCLGITNGGNSHTVHEYIDLAPVQTGLEQVLQILHRAWDALEPRPADG